MLFEDWLYWFPCLTSSVSHRTSWTTFQLASWLKSLSQDLTLGGTKPKDLNQHMVLLCKLEDGTFPLEEAASLRVYAWPVWMFPTWSPDNFMQVTQSGQFYTIFLLRWLIEGLKGPGKFIHLKSLSRSIFFSPYDRYLSSSAHGLSDSPSTLNSGYQKTHPMLTYLRHEVQIHGLLCKLLRAGCVLEFKLFRFWKRKTMHRSYMANSLKFLQLCVEHEFVPTLQNLLVLRTFWISNCM